MKAKAADADPRIVAIAVLKEVLEKGVSLTAALSVLPESRLNESQCSLTSALCYGVLRWYVRLDYILSQLLQRPLRKRESDVRMLLLVGLYQLSEQRVPDYASVSEAVETVVRLDKAWAKSLVNGVLRSFIRQREQLLEKADQKEAIRYAFPTWLCETLRQDWGDDSVEMMRASNEQAPMTLRLNLQKTTTSDYLNLLENQQVEAYQVVESRTAIQLAKPCDVVCLPGFEQGVVSVQDAAAQLAAELLDVQAGERVLDACAAPGGKSGHILERQPNVGRLVCVDIDEQRIRRIEENLQRIEPNWQEKVSLLTADLLDVDAWWDGAMFDRILLDAPCSATGVIRRHPDIKHLRKRRDIDALVEVQLKMLQRMWALLKPGGRLLYATCSVLQCENEQQIAAFIDSTAKKHNQSSDAIQLLQMAVPYAQARSVGYQIFPGDNGADGFYYAALQKT